MINRDERKSTFQARDAKLEKKELDADAWPAR